MEASNTKVPIVVSVDFFDFKGDLMSEVARCVYGHGAVHIGLMLDEDRYLFPHPSQGLTLRKTATVYRKCQPELFIQLMGYEPLDLNWFEKKFKGRRLSNTFVRLVTEPMYVFSDLGADLALPKRETCVSQITDVLRELNIVTFTKTSQALYHELVGHPMRVG